MTAFTKRFIWRYALSAFILSSVSLTLVSSVWIYALNGLVSSHVSGSAVMYIFANMFGFTMFKSTAFVCTAVTAVISAAVVYWIARWCIRSASKNCTEYLQNPDKWFRNFYIIIIAYRCISLFLVFNSVNRKINEAYSLLGADNAQERFEWHEEALMIFDKAFVFSLIIMGIVEAVVLLPLLTKMKEKYINIIPTEME